MQTFIKLQLAFIFFISFEQIWSQETGRTFIRNYPPIEYKASQQNWAIAQDRRGIMYFGNNDGLLEFDGINWRLIKLPIVRSIAIDSLGRIYVGLENDMGYLDPDSIGNYQYHSLKAEIPEKYRNLSTVLYVYIVGEQVIFLADDKLFIYKDGHINVVSSENGFHHMFRVRNRLYVREQGKGLSYLAGDSLRFIEGSGRFASERIYSILPYRRNGILIATRTQGIFTYSPDNPAEFRKPQGFKEVDDFLLKNPVYCGTVLASGNLAIGALTGGIIVFTPDGKITNRYNKSTGLQDNTTYWLYSDQNHQLWATFDNGISLIPVNLPFRIFTEHDGLNGSPMCLNFFNNRLYVGTSQYLHIQNKQGNFEPIAGTEGQNFQLFEVNGTLLLAGYQGVFEIRDKRAIPLTKNSNIIALSFCMLKNHPGYLLVGSSDDGLYLMQYKNASWKLIHRIKGFKKSVYDAIEDKSENIWISTTVELYKLRVNSTLDSVISFQQYTREQGLPSNFAFPYALNSGEVVFGTEKGIYRYRRDKDRLEPHPDFRMLTGKILPFVQVKNGDIWFEELLTNGNYQKGVLKLSNGRYILYNKPFYKFLDVRCYESPFSICAAPDNTIFIETSSGLLQYIPSAGANIDQPFKTLIRKVFSRDKLLFGGAEIQTDAKAKREEIPYLDNDIIIDFASAFYEDPEKNLYSFRLIGSDTTWSTWVNDHKKEYTNLWEGNYTFEVRSKNQYQTRSSVASYSFRILPPWYRTWLAYIGYLIFFGLALYSLVHFRTRKLQARSLALEKTVDMRTAQLQEQKNDVEKLSRIGKDITSSLSIENIIHTVYENVNTLMDASVFSIGLHKPEENSLEFPATIEKNQLLPPFSVSLSDRNRLAAWCFNNRQDVLINDYALDYSKYIGELSGPLAGENPESVLYMPLWNKEKVVGVITAQSFKKNAYTDYHLNMLRNLATYTAIALENADAYRRLTALLEELKAAQDRLVTQSKLAALGELTAGIAHEIQNPLNFVNNFSEVSNELLDEMKLELARGNNSEAKLLADNVKTNLEKIHHHGKRADSIVKGMLQHSHSSSGVKTLTDINTLADEYLRLSYHGLRAKDKSFNATMKTDFDTKIGKINVVSQDIGRVILNLLTNAFYAVTEKNKLDIKGYEPVVSLSTKMVGDKVEIKVGDNGDGIPQEFIDKIFQPFFTTKPAGQGTGLGLSMSYDIVKAHGGEIKVQTKEGEGAEFMIYLNL